MPAAVTPRRRVSSTLAALGLAAGLAVFAWGIVHLFELRFSLGDVYPPYSTLRADPLGAEAVFEAFAAQPGLSVERNLRPLDRLGKIPVGGSPGRDAADDPALACFYLGADAYEWPFTMDNHAAADRLETILRRGGRVVVTFLPVTAPLTVRHLESVRRLAGFPAAAPRGGSKPTPAATPRGRARAELPPDLILRWGIDFHRAKVRDRNDEPPPSSTPAAAIPVGDDAPGVSWHSTATFDLDAAPARAAGWRTLYQRGGQPVIVARTFGDKGGELILASDSYFLSNEALRAEPHPALLAALVGSSRHLIFDESHFGINEHPGVMTLARRYRLQGALAALGLLAVLFVWKNTLSLVPPSAGSESDASTAVPGRDSAAGFLNLLRRGVPVRDLPAVCLAQWEQTHAGASHPPPGALERLRAVVQEDAARPARQRGSAASVYRAMCAALAGGSRPPGAMAKPEAAPTRL